MGMIKMVTCHYAYDNSAKGIVEHIQYLKSIGCELYDIELMNTAVDDRTIPRYITIEERRRHPDWDWCKDGDLVYEFDRDTAYSTDRPDEKVSYERWCKFKASEREAGRDIGTFLGDPFK